MIQRPRALLLPLMVGVALALVEVRIAEAAPIQFRMTGKIDVVYQVGALPSGIYQDAPFEAILSYDLATPDSRADDPTRGYYYSTDGVDDNYLLIRAGASEIRSKHSLGLWIGNDVDEMQELFEARDDTFSIFDTEITTNFEVSQIAKMGFHWNDPTRSALSSDALPTSLDPTRFSRAVDPTLFTPPYIEVSTFQIDPRVHQFTVYAFVESIEVVPEPGTITSSLIAVALIATSRGMKWYSS